MMTSLNVTLTAIGLAGLLVGPAMSQAATEEVTGIAAVVNGKPITTAEARNAALSQIQMMLIQEGNSMTRAEFERRRAEIEKNALKDLIDRQLILDEFESLEANIPPQHIEQAIANIIRDRFGNDKDKFQSELKEAGMTISQFREQQKEMIIIQAMRSRNAKTDDLIVTPREMEEFLKNNRELFASEGKVKLRTITVPKLANGDPTTAASQKALIEEIRAKLQDGADFGAMARAYSVDSGASDDGVRGTFARGDLNSQVADAAFSIPVQTVSEVIDLGDFYSLAYVDARDAGDVPPLSQIEDEVRRRVLQNKRQERVEVWLERLRRDANITVFE